MNNDHDPSEEGIAFVLTNEAMPGYVRIDTVSNALEYRIKELSASSTVPHPFVCVYACRIENRDFIERLIYGYFDTFRTDQRKKFFQIVPDRVIALLKILSIKDVTPQYSDTLY